MITVDLTTQRQEIDGFGADLTEQFPMSERVLDILFDPVKGIGCSLARYHAGLDSYNAASSGVNHYNVPLSLTGQTPRLDESTPTRFDMLQAAVARGARVWVCGWPSYDWTGMVGGPPAPWQGPDDGEPWYHREVLPANWAATAEYLVAACEDAISRGVPIYAVSAFNEPDGYGAYWSPDNFVTFMTTHFGPRVRSRLPTTKILAPETGRFSLAPVFIDPLLAAAPTMVDIAAGHSYDGPAVAKTYPAALAAGKKTWISEGAPADLWDPEGYASGSETDIGNGLRNSMALAAGMNDGLSSWSYWWYRSHGASAQGWGADFPASHVGIFGPTADPTRWAVPDPDDTGMDRRRAWMFGNWARFVRPGWHRVDATVAPADADLACNAFVGSNGRWAIVLVNQSVSPKPVDLTITGASGGFATPYLTDLTHNIEAQASAALSGSSLSYTVPARSVVTLVNWIVPLPAALPGGSVTSAAAREWTVDAGAGGAFGLSAVLRSLSGSKIRISVDGVAQGADFVIPSQEEEGDPVPAHTVNESAVSLSTANATRIDPNPAAANRYKIVVVNTHASDRIYVGYGAGVTTSTGHLIEPESGEREFFIDANVTLYAIRGGSNAVSVLVKEYVTA